MPTLMFLMLVDRKIFTAAATEEGLVHLRHVFEEPFDVGPLATELALLSNFARLDPAGIVQLYFVRDLMSRLTLIVDRLKVRFYYSVGHCLSYGNGHLLIQNDSWNVIEVTAMSIAIGHGSRVVIGVSR